MYIIPNLRLYWNMVIIFWGGVHKDFKDIFKLKKKCVVLIWMIIHRIEKVRQNDKEGKALQSKSI
jgi:hypothetical protein